MQSDGRATIKEQKELGAMRRGKSRPWANERYYTKGDLPEAH